MPSVASQAHFKIGDLDREGVDHDSPLEDQVVLIYRAVSRYADANHWRPTAHRGIQGRVGTLVMKRLIRDLFPKAGPQQIEKINGLANQVLRKTDAAVCKERPHGRDSLPIWFVADRMPANIVIVALSHARRDQDNEKALVPRTDKERDIAYVERKLTPEEAGETMEPGAVTVKQGEPKPRPQPNGSSETRDVAFAEARERRAREHVEFRDRVFMLVKEHQPCTAVDLVHFLAKEGRTTEDSSAVRYALRELEEDHQVVSRLEVDSERRVRGGGSFPKGKRMLLFAIAPGPVPTRTTLPEGIEPYRPASEWDAAKKAELEGWCDKVIEALGYRGTHEDRPPRFVKDLSKHTGLYSEQVDLALQRLISLGLVVKRSSRYYLSDNKGRERSATPVQDQPLVDTVPPTVQPEAPALPAAMVDGTDLVAQAHALIDQLAGGGIDPAELESLRARNEYLENENARLGRAVESLRAAIANLS